MVRLEPAIQELNKKLDAFEEAQAGEEVAIAIEKDDELERDIENAAGHTETVLEARVTAETLLRNVCPVLKPAVSSSRGSNEEGFQAGSYVES